MDLKSLWNDALVGGHVSVHSAGLNGTVRSSYVRKSRAFVTPGMTGYQSVDGLAVARFPNNWAMIAATATVVKRIKYIGC
jgi:hypothetical protein